MIRQFTERIIAKYPILFNDFSKKIYEKNNKTHNS